MSNVCIVCGEQIEKRESGKNYSKFCSQSCYRKDYREKNPEKWKESKRETARRKAELVWNSKEDVYCRCCGKRIEYSIPQKFKFCSDRCSKEKTPESLEKQRLSKAKWLSNNREKVNESRKVNRKTPYLSRLEVLRNKYGLSEEDYESIRDVQKGRCAICGKSLEPPCVDHCHETGRVRGLLCVGCNTAIGQFKDDVEVMKKAIDYIEFYKA